MKIRPYQHEGAWVSSYIGYYKFAWLSYKDFLGINKELGQLESKLRDEVLDEDKSLMDSYIHYKTQNMVSEAHRFAESAIIFSALTIEGFLNDYGLKRIGEKLYLELLERKSPAQKFKLIWHICFDEELKNDVKSYQAIKKLFKERNMLVHPKTTIFDFENQIVQLHPSELEIDVHLEYMDLILSEFFKKDNTIPKEFFKRDYEK